jgi:hypothetical protein
MTSSIKNQGGLPPRYLGEPVEDGSVSGRLHDALEGRSSVGLQNQGRGVTLTYIYCGAAELLDQLQALRTYVGDDDPSGEAPHGPKRLEKQQSGRASSDDEDAANGMASVKPVAIGGLFYSIARMENTAQRFNERGGDG